MSTSAPPPDADQTPHAHETQKAGPATFRTRWWRAGGASVALAGLVWGASTTGGPVGAADPRPDDDAAGATAGPSAVALVTSAALACPGPDGTGSSAGPPPEVVAALAPPSVVRTAAPHRDAGPDDTSATTSPEDLDGGAVLLLSGDGDGDGERRGDGGRPVQPLEPRSVEPDGVSAAFVVGQDDAAPGLVGGQLVVGTDPGTRGAALTPCGQPAEELWLVGGDGRAGAAERLLLSNPGTDPVTVEVRVWGPDGEVATTGASGLVVPAGGRVDHLLDALAPGVEAPVVSVSATGGPVAAHLGLLVRDGTSDLGAETVAPSSVPATDLVVPAPPAAPEGAEHRVVLRLLAPGDAEAVVDLTALTEDGAVRLPDLVTRATAGRTVQIDLEELPAGTTGLRLRADAPVVAGAGMEIGPAEGEPEEVAPADGAEDTGAPPDEDAATAAPGADAAGATADPAEEPRREPLVRPAGDLAWTSSTPLSPAPVGMAVPDPAAAPGGVARLVLGAVDATTATVHWLDEDGATSTEVVELGNDTGHELDVPTDARAVWVTTTGRLGQGPGAGVAAAVHVTGADDRGPLVAAATLPAVPWTRTVTTVRPAVP